MRYDGKFIWRELGICFVNDNGDGNDDGGGGGNDDDKDKNKIPPEKAEEVIQNLRKVERANRKELETLRKFKEDAENASKTESEKLQERIAKLEEENNSFKAKEREGQYRSAIAAIAKDANAVYPDMVYDLIKANLEFDNNGKITNSEDAIKELKTARPALFTDGSNIDQNQQDRNRNGNSGRTMNDIIRRRG